ncbi:MAG: hypothetical protein J6386_06610 [Candidatus Synoicihabitans palmerolidicus]|nr:hypothetical protein [Candidatus Synoicihabitans palmerolidicus]
MLNEGVPNVEMHIYAREVHPGDRSQEGQAPATAGIALRDGVGFGTWQERYVDWLDDLSFLDKPGVVTRAALNTAAHIDRENPFEILKSREETRRAAVAAAKQD